LAIVLYSRNFITIVEALDIEIHKYWCDYFDFYLGQINAFAVDRI